MDTTCTETTFTTEILTNAPPCISNIAPTNGSIDVRINSEISWNSVAGETGYFISIGTAPGLTDVLNNFDNGNSTTYNPPADFLEGTTYYVTITPYNAVGNATACVETSFTTEIIPTIPPCTTTVAPADGAIDVVITTDITWNTEASATGYFISIGTAPGLTDVLNNFDNGNNTTYNPPTDFLEGTTYYVTITPYNTVGNATACAETSFTTEIIPTIPPCTTTVAPADGAIDVVITTDITWNTEASATGYFISIGTAPGLTDVLNNFDNGNNTTYNPPTDFLEGTTYYVTITPYNTVGNATACAETSFTTEIIPTIPPCTTIIAPADGELEVELNSNINWYFSPGATGYMLSIGTTPGGTDILANFDNGNNTVWSNTIGFPENTVIYVSITPYNGLGDALDCNDFTFTTVNLRLIIPQYFTPNQDGFNDLWRIDDPTNEVKSVSIMDRFGKLLYQSNTAPHLWDGLFNNQPLQSSDYWYIIELVDGNILKGHFSLIRY